MHLVKKLATKFCAVTSFACIILSVRRRDYYVAVCIECADLGYKHVFVLSNKLCSFEIVL